MSEERLTDDFIKRRAFDETNALRAENARLRGDVQANIDVLTRLVRGMEEAPTVSSPDPAAVLKVVINDLVLALNADGS